MGGSTLDLANPLAGADFAVPDEVCKTTCMNGGCLGCLPGAVDKQPCGNCGTHSRTCMTGGSWSAFSPCAAEGTCAPGTTRLEGCGNRGTLTYTCSKTCEWTTGACRPQPPSLRVQGGLQRQPHSVVPQNTGQWSTARLLQIQLPPVQLS